MNFRLRKVIEYAGCIFMQPVMQVFDIACSVLLVNVIQILFHPGELQR